MFDEIPQICDILAASGGVTSTFRRPPGKDMEGALMLPQRLKPDHFKPKARDRSSEVEVKPCACCGKEFIRNRRKLSHSQWEAQRFCSSRCASTIPMGERLSWASERDDETGCRNWTGTIVRGGYGRIVARSAEGKRIQIAAHRAAYETWVGQIPNGMMVLHSCDNPRCINPDHLRVGDHADNMADKVARQRCRNQHGRAKKYAPAAS